MKFIMQRKYSILLVILIAGLLTSCSVQAVTNRFAAKHPTDQAMLKNWRAHKNEFEHLRQMYSADKQLASVTATSAYPFHDAGEIGINANRLAEYRDYFQKLRLTNGIYGDDGKERVWFRASDQGFAMTATIKGYVFTKLKPEVLVEGLDNFRFKEGQGTQAYRHIEGDWYLYFEIND